MVVVLSNNDFSDAVAEIIERDYFPSNERKVVHSTDKKSLTDFHRTTTSATAVQLHETLEEKGRAKSHKQSLIYASNHASTGIKLTATAELRNALFFPAPTTEISTEATSMMMPPPIARKPAPLSLKRNNSDHCSLTTLNTDQATNVTSSKVALINSSATRFPTKSTHSRRRICGKRKNCFKDDNTELHWEGSTETGEEDDSYFTDLDATTVDSYSIRRELQKSQSVSRRNMETQRIPTLSSVGTECASTVGMSNSFVYQLPRESPRDLSASVVFQERNQETKAHLHRYRQNHGAALHGQRPSTGSIKSLRSALKESYKKRPGKLKFGVKS